MCFNPSLKFSPRDYHPFSLAKFPPPSSPLQGQGNVRIPCNSRGLSPFAASEGGLGLSRAKVKWQKASSKIVDLGGFCGDPVVKNLPSNLGELESHMPGATQPMHHNYWSPVVWRPLTTCRKKPMHPKEDSVCRNQDTTQPKINK